MKTTEMIKDMTVNSIGKGNFNIIHPYSQNYLVKTISCLQRVWDLVNVDPYSGKYADMLAYTEQEERLHRSALACKVAIIEWCKACRAEFDTFCFIPEFKEKTVLELVPNFISWYQVIEDVIVEFNSNRIAG